jgi:hypothetical protein
VVEIVRSGTFNGVTADSYAGTNNDDFIGTISNANFYRFWDGTCGSYKVPVRIVAPKAASCGSGRLADVGLVEMIHPYLIGSASPGDFEGVIHGWNDPVYDPLLDHGFHEAWANLRVPFLFGNPDEHGGGASLPENQGLGLHLERPRTTPFCIATFRSGCVKPGHSPISCTPAAATSARSATSSASVIPIRAPS